MPGSINERERKAQKLDILSAKSIMTELARAGFRYTQPRSILAEYIARKEAEGADFTIEGLWHEVRVLHPGIGRVTVFRMVDVLVSLGMIDRVTFSDGSTCYHVSRGKTHQYMTCEHCHKIVELNQDAARHLLHTLAHLVGFDLSQRHVEIAGLCPECQQQ